MVATSLRSSAIAEWLIRKSPLLSKTQPVLVALLAFSAALNLAIYYTDVRGLLGHNDFRLYYAGAEVGLRYGWSHIYDVSLHQAAVAALQPTGPWYAMLTPAPIAWLVSPLTMLGYPAAYWVWVALSIAALAAAVWYVRPRQHSAALYFLWWAALGPLWFSAYEGQVTILATAGLLAGWRLLETRRDYVGGLVLAAALFKPYLVLLLPLTLLASGRVRALLGFMTVAAAAGVGMLVTLHPQGIQDYIAMLLAPQAAGDTAKTLRSALGGSPALLAIQAGVVIAVIAISVHARRSHVVWPVVTSALLGSFLLATYWHPQDYLAIDGAAAIMLTAGPRKLAVLIAAAIAIVSALATPLTAHQSALAWLLLALIFLGFLGLRTLTPLQPERPLVATQA